MSLHALAGHMSTKGRNGDSMLVHMTPGEVAGLQALAIKEGGSLTINPDTGLPEANFLKSILPMVAGFALGPAGFGLMSAGMAGAAVGGVTALATGSLSRGLMAGMGAYGGASLGASLSSAGTGAMAASDIAAQQAAGTFPTMAEGMTTEAYAAQVGAARDAAIAKAGEAGMGAKMSAGFGQMASNPGMYGKELLTGLATISPMLADQGVQTTTQRPDTGTIRNYTFDPYGQTYTSAGNYPASEYKGMAHGGIVALADGGPTPAFTPFSGSQINQYIRDNNLDAAGITAATQQFNVDPNAVINAQNAQEQIQDVYRNVLGRDADPSGMQYWTDRIVQGGVSGQDMYNEFLHGARTNNEIIRNPNLTLEEALQDYSGYTSSDQTNIADEWVRNTLGREVTDADRSQQWYKDATNASSMNTYDTAQNIFGQFKDYATRTGQSPVDAYADALAQISGIGLTEADVLAQTGKTLRELVRGPNLGLGLFEASQLNAPGSVFDFNSLQARKTTPIVDAGNLPGGVSGGGNTVVNENGTITTAPNIPGRPEGGFTGMGQVKDVYTQGGGSLGYTNNAPKTMEEFNQRFNTQTGDSKAAYDYLVGKGAYPTKSGVEQLMRPYKEATLGMPVAKDAAGVELRANQKYIFENGKYVENPNYRPLSYNNKGERIVGLTPTEVIQGLAPFKDAADDAAMFDFVTENSISEAQLTAALGISIAEARARIAAGKKAKKPEAATTAIDGGGGGDSVGVDGPAGGPGGGPGSGTGTGSDSPGASGSDSGGGPGSGGAGGCVDPNVMVLLADGGQVRAGDLCVGDMLHTLHEDTFVYGNFPVEFVEIIQQPKVEAGFDGNQKIIVSTTHKFLTADGVWKQMRDLVIGDVVRATGDATKKLTSVTTLGEGPVVKMTVTEAHTYIADGLVSHNKARGGMVRRMALGGLGALAGGGSTSQYNLGGYSDGGRLLRGPGDGVSDSIPATIGNKQPARLADGEFVVPARIVSELGNGSTEAGARKLYAMMDRVQKARGKTTGKSRVAANTRSDKYLPA